MVWGTANRVAFKFILYLALLVTGYFLGRLECCDVERQQPSGIVSVQEAIKQGYVVGEVKKPEIKDLPKGAKPLATIAGGIVWKERQPVSNGGPLSASVGSSPTVPAHGSTLVAPQQDWPLASDLACQADCSLIQIGSEVLGRLRCGAALQGPNGGPLISRDLTPIGDARLKINPSLLKPRWRLDFIGGVSFGGPTGVEGGLLWSRRHWGGYAMVEYLPAYQWEPSRFRYHAGFRYVIH
jgi:hypothetical protein